MFSNGNRTQQTPTSHLSNRGVALLPDQDFSARCIELQQRALTFLDLEPRLSLTENRPHLTLVQGLFGPAIDFPGLLSRVQMSCNTGATVTLEPLELVYKPRGWIFLAVVRNELLDDLHRSIADLASPHMTPPAEDRTAPVGYSEEETASYRQFGYRYMYDCFYPHVTLGRVATPPTDGEMARLTSLATELGLFLPFRVAGASVYEMGPDGAHARSILAVDLPDIKS